MNKLTVGIFGIILLAGCGSGGNGSIDPYQDPAQIAARAPEMSLAALEKSAKQAGRAIVQRREEAVKLEEQIRTVPFREQYEKKANDLRAHASAVQQEISRLRRLYDIYMEAYLKKGGRFERIRVPGV